MCSRRGVIKAHGHGVNYGQGGRKVSFQSGSIFKKRNLAILEKDSSVTKNGGEEAFLSVSQESRNLQKGDQNTIQEQISKGAWEPPAQYRAGKRKGSGREE